MNIETFVEVGVLNRQSQAYISNALKNINISYSECVFLSNLYNNEGINQEELSSILFIDKTLTAKSIKSLEEKGFLIRERCEIDKRSKRLYLTDKGRGCKEEIFSRLEKWINFITDGMDIKTKNVVFNGLRLMSERAASANFDELLQNIDENGNKD
ncbi:DNA-binding transcriptional regulator, MarR family [Clostridium acidisoli DSM 12555]|uniref:DNA-binding transcriptional regulator, MarR family n=1 Tax=Clostridium acidisoli DSM 12555 TaxID=1121291 RepID=A0A1W1XHP6_9CLOT|nr:MarR family transcriptional regulator [Clostridium acidisoli]SMC23357.1 DNA-binding transcriptional regulator, MarR family [Clostridium acidisoli DSM 12555]